MDRKNELKQQYKILKPEMGIFIIRSKTNNKYYLHSTNNLKGVMNGDLFKLSAGGHRIRELQKEWKEAGEENFIVEILEKLDYQEDENKTDYSQELELLEMIWEEKLAKENCVLYKK
jgi:hypothetical protein